MNEPRKLRVFLCHASQDKPVVRELYQRLDAEGWIDPWLDKEKLLPGQDWGLEMEKSVEATDAVIVFLSNEAVMREGYFQKELRKIIAIAEEKPEGVIFIIPIRLDECPIPRSLQKWHYEDYFPESNKEFVYKQIIESLRLRANVLKLVVEEVTDKQESAHPHIEKTILFYLDTEAKFFIDWFYQNYYYKDLPIGKRGKLPTKASEYFYKPIGPYLDNDPILIKLITEREISGRRYKGTIFLEIETISLSPNPRISVTIGFEGDDFFLVFYRTLAGIAKVYKESRDLITPYLEKYRKDYEAINPERLLKDSNVQSQVAEFKYVQLDLSTIMKEYMHKDTFDGYKVSLKYRILDKDGSIKNIGILHFQVVRMVGEILDELLKLRKIEENVQYKIEAKVPINLEESGILIEKGSEIILRPIADL
jgi:hypothetical protein